MSPIQPVPSMHSPIVRRMMHPTETEIHQITDWMYGWWGIAEGYTIDEVDCYVRHGFHPTRFPHTYGLYLDETLIGCFQFTLNDFELRPDIYPWLANLFLAPPYRGFGYGRILIEGAISAARAQNIFNELYLYTSHDGLYEKFGWTFVEWIDTFRKEPRMQRLYRMDL